MHNRVHVRTVGILNGLREGMRGIKMIVPKQNQSAKELM